MTSREIGLGNLEHIKDSQNLKLRTHVALTFSHISSSTISDPIQIESLLSTDTWIAGANRLHIHSHFLFDDVQVSDHENVTFVEEIGLRFRSAEIWSQLGFDVAHEVVGEDPEGGHPRNELVLSLTRRASSHGNVGVPHKVPSVSLDSIDLLFEFSTCRHPRVPFNPLHQSIMPLATDLLRTASRSPEADRLSMLQDSPGLKRQWHGADFASVDQVRDWVSSPDEGTRETLRTLHRSSSIPNSQMSVPPPSTRSLERSNTLSNQSFIPISKHAPQHVEFEHFSELLDASLRLIVCDRETFKYQGVILSKDTGFPRLVCISPALFSPYYLKAMSQRNEFLHKIARSMCGVYRRTKSSGFRQKLDRVPTKISEERLAKDTTELGGSVSNLAEINAITQARLWRLMQHKLLNSQAWSRRPFRLLNDKEKICATTLGSLMLDSPLTDESIRASPEGESIDLMLDSQNSSIEGAMDPEIRAHVSDITASVEAQRSGLDASVHDESPADDNAAGDKWLGPDWNTVSKNRTTEVSFSQERTGKSDYETGEDLSQADRYTQSLVLSSDNDMLDYDTYPGPENIHDSQVSSISGVRTEFLDGRNGNGDEVLDREHIVLGDQRRYPKNSAPGYSCDRDREMTLEKEDSLLDCNLDQILVWNEGDQDMLDIGQDSNDKYPSLSALEYMDHDEGLEDLLDSLQGKHPPTYEPSRHGCQGLVDDAEVILDYWTPVKSNPGCSEDFWNQNRDEMLDSDCEAFKVKTWNEKLLCS